MSDKAYRILIVDDDPDYQRLNSEDVADWGYEPIVAEGVGQALYQDAITKCRQYRCHAAIVDLRLEDHQNPNDKAGLELVSELSPALCIIYTGFGSIPITVEAVKDKGSFDLVSKTAHISKLRQTVVSAIEQWHRKIVVSPTEKFDRHVLFALHDEGAGDIDAVKEEVIYALSHLFPTDDSLSIDSIAKGVRTPEKLSDSQSIVFRVQAPGRQEQIVKLSFKQGDIKKEISNYDLYVDGQLGGNYRPELRGNWHGWQISGVTYSLLSSQGDIRTFSRHYAYCLHSESASSESAIEPLKFFHETVWQPKYNDPDNVKRLTGTLFDVYNKHWKAIFDQRDIADSWRQGESRYTLADYDIELLNPYRWLVTNGYKSNFADARVHIAHGDFHGENLFVNEAQAWPIDFERTGVAHTLTDFVQMERNLITRMASIRSPELFYEFVVALLSAQCYDENLWKPQYNSHYVEIEFALEFISQHRQIAQRCTKFSSMMEFYWGLLLDCMYVLGKLAGRLDDVERERTELLASLICHRLENELDGQWPPRGHPPIREIYACS